MKENQHVQPIIDVEGGIVTFKVKGHDDITLDWSKLSPEVQMRAGLAGMAQVRIVDRAAVGMTDDDGNILSEADRIAMKHSRMAELVEHYHTGTSEWNLAGTGGGGRSITIEAIGRVKGISYDEAKAEVEKFANLQRKMPNGSLMSYKGDTKKALAFLRSGKAVSEAIAAIRAERTPAPKVDADAALAELGGE